MRNLTFRDVTYRLYRLRRLVIVAMLIPMPFIALAIWTGVSVGWWLAAVWIAFVLIHSVRFPNAWIDQLAMSIGLAILLILAPAFGFIGLGPIIGYPLAMIAWFVIWMSLIGQITRLDGVPFRREKFVLRRRSKLSPAEMRAAFFLRPNAQVGFHLCHEADENGVFMVEPQGISTIGFQLGDDFATDQTDDQSDSECAALSQDFTPDFNFFATILESDETHQETVVLTNATDDESEANVTSMIETITPAKNGAIYEKREYYDKFTLLAGLGFWLQDYNADHFTATIDHVSGKPARALRSAPKDSLLTLLANWFISRRLSRIEQA